MTILIDASVWCAYANTVDVHHKRAKILVEKMLKGMYGDLVTSDYIFDETVTVALRRAGIKTARELGKYLLCSEIQVADIDDQVFRRAWEIFQQRDCFSFTDCTSIAFMHVFNLKRIATFDKAFTEVKGIEVISV